MKLACIAILLALVSITKAIDTKNRSFECFVCNKDPHEDDSEPCIERVEACAPEVTSCSSVAFRSADGKMRTRKFCTSPGVPIYQYLMLFPGSSLCQNIETTSVPAPPAEPINLPGPDGKPQKAMPPAPPSRESSTLLCVCTKPKCNGGTYREVMQRTMLKNLEIPGLDDDDRLKKHNVLTNKEENPNAIKFF